MNELTLLIVLIGIGYLALQTVYKYNLDYVYDEWIKPLKILPRTFCTQCFVTQFTLLITLIIVPLLGMCWYNIPLLSLSTAGFVTYLSKIDDAKQ